MPLITPGGVCIFTFLGQARPPDCDPALLSSPGNHFVRCYVMSPSHCLLGSSQIIFQNPAGRSAPLWSHSGGSQTGVHTALWPPGTFSSGYLSMCRIPEFNHLCSCPSSTARGEGAQGLEDTNYSGLREMRAIRFGSGAGVAGAHSRWSLLEVEKIPPIFVSHRVPFDWNSWCKVPSHLLQVMST